MEAIEIFLDQNLQHPPLTNRLRRFDSNLVGFSPLANPFERKRHNQPL